MEYLWHTYILLRESPLGYPHGTHIYYWASHQRNILIAHKYTTDGVTNGISVAHMMIYFYATHMYYQGSHQLDISVAQAPTTEDVKNGIFLWHTHLVHRKPLMLYHHCRHIYSDLSQLGFAPFAHQVLQHVDYSIGWHACERALTGTCLMKLYFAVELGSSTFSMPLDDDSAAGDPVSMFGFTSPIGVGVVGVV